TSLPKRNRSRCAVPSANGRSVMTKITVVSAVFGAALVALLPGASAWAVTQQIAWVASNGMDTNDCTRAAPCATFQRAHNQTDPGGQIHCVDGKLQCPDHHQGDHTIDCTATGGATALDAGSIPTIIINGNFVDVTLRGLYITGNGTGEAGIVF